MMQDPFETKKIIFCKKNCKSICKITWKKTLTVFSTSCTCRREKSFWILVLSYRTCQNIFFSFKITFENKPTGTGGALPVCYRRQFAVINCGGDYLGTDHYHHATLPFHVLTPQPFLPSTLSLS